MTSSVGEGGALAIVLHTHMPYVHGYGTWPFGEEWLWEVYATSYLPVAELAARAPLTVSLTPVVGDQLDAPGAAGRCLDFYDRVRRGSHDEDLHWMRQKPVELAGEIAAAEYSWSRHEAAITGIHAHADDLLGPLAAASTWTSAATHAVLPLLATEAGVRLQVASGVASHRRRTGAWGGGLWLPECAWDPELEGPLVAEGVRTVCLEVTGRGEGVLAPWRTPGGLQIAPIDRTLIDLIWHHTGYPGAADYRDSHRRSYQNTPLWANGGGAYDPQAGKAQAEADAAAWARACAERLRGGQTAVVAFDTELFGHWWHEGPAFLAAAVEALGREGVELVQLDELLARTAADLPVAEAPPASTWGAGRDLRTWTGPAVSTIAWELRRAELAVLAGREPGGPGDAALRDLLALQSSDWAFMVTEERAASYGWARFADHRQAVDRCSGPLPSSAPRLRHLAPDLARDALAVG